jgi:hypothetical protein
MVLCPDNDDDKGQSGQQLAETIHSYSIMKGSYPMEPMEREAVSIANTGHVAFIQSSAEEGAVCAWCGCQGLVGSDGHRPSCNGCFAPAYGLLRIFPPAVLPTALFWHACEEHWRLLITEVYGSLPRGLESVTLSQWPSREDDAFMYYTSERLTDLRRMAVYDDPDYYQREPTTVDGLLHQLDLAVASMAETPAEAQQLVAESVARAMETWGPGSEDSL